MYCVGWFGKIVLNKVIRNKQILIDEDTCWKFGGDEVPGGSVKWLTQLVSDFNKESERYQN